MMTVILFLVGLGLLLRDAEPAAVEKGVIAREEEL
jgi:hypothetical protein